MKRYVKQYSYIRTKNFKQILATSALCYRLRNAFNLKEKGLLNFFVASNCATYAQYRL